MKLIADSGSTKTDWCLMSDGGNMRFSTQGINPFHQSAETINGILEKELIPQLRGVRTVDEVFFYGAGCTREKSAELVNAMHTVFGDSAKVEAEGDMLGAARAMCQHSEGIACILGTGANSCYYDGEVIKANIPPLGYILGDEGSAAYIGRRLIGNIVKQQFSPCICDTFFEETRLDVPYIINKVYREPMANRFLGQVSQFCQSHRADKEVHEFLIDCFSQFFIRNVRNYHHDTLPVHFVGSIAWAYEPELREAAESTGFHVGNISRSPMEGLITFHS